MSLTVSIVTPWLDHPEFIEDYERAVAGPDVEVIVVDNGSSPANEAALYAMIGRLGGKHIRNEQNRWFAPANNQGLAQATGQIVLFLNNDISAVNSAWLTAVRRDVGPDMLAGPAARKARLDRLTLPYLEGWCIAARREVWDLLGGWNEEAFKMPYWEDTELSFRAGRAGIRLCQTDWPLKHKWNGTIMTIPAARSSLEHNRRVFSSLLRGQPVPQTSRTAINENIEIQQLKDFLETGRLTEAEESSCRAVEKQPEGARLWLDYGAVLGCSGRYDAAIDALRKAVALDRTLHAETSREMDNILAAFDHALKADPFNHVIIDERRRLSEKWKNPAGAA